MSTEPLCELLPWDTAFFGVRIARATVSRLTPAVLEQILDWCRAQTVRCLYLLADVDDPQTARLAARAAFLDVGMRVTLEQQPTAHVARPSPVQEAVTTRPVRGGDVPALKAIAAASYHDSRFFVDPHFTPAKATALFVTWIERSCCEGFADAVWIAERSGEPIGYVTCHLEPSQGRIGLLGVHPGARGNGVGTLLVQASASWFCAHGVSRVSVVTQGDNRIAQRLYERNGFRPRAVHRWYHKWL